MMYLIADAVFTPFYHIIIWANRVKAAYVNNPWTMLPYEAGNVL